MIFCNLNLNLKQFRVSLKIPKIVCKNKISLEVRKNGEIILNQKYKLIIDSNLDKFSLNPLSLRQFHYSETDNLIYNLNFIIDCDLEYTCSDEKCTVQMPSDNEMAIDWAYCCGNNQEKHLQNIRLNQPGLKSDESKNESKKELNNRHEDCSRQLRDKELSKEELINLTDLNHFFILLTKQKLFTKFLIESTNRTEYLILHKLNNRCLIAFNEDDDGIYFQSNLNKVSKNFRLKEAIFVEFIYIDYKQKPADVKNYRHSFDYEFMRLDCQLFDKLFENLYRINKSILPFTAKFNTITKFNYSYLLM